MEFLVENIEKKFGQGKRNTILKKQCRESRYSEDIRLWVLAKENNEVQHDGLTQLPWNMSNNLAT